jgi:hypothetical protein
MLGVCVAALMDHTPVGSVVFTMLACAETSENTARPESLTCSVRLPYRKSSLRDPLKR